MKRIPGQEETSGRRHPILYSRPGKNTGDTSGSAARTITLKPAPAKTVLPIPEVQGCFAPGEKLRNREKNKDASVKPANFSENSGLKESTSA